MSSRISDIFVTKSKKAFSATAKGHFPATCLDPRFRKPAREPIPLI
jgi:hypothetical protein